MIANWVRIAGTAWGCGLGLGMLAMVRFELQAGKAGTPPSYLPSVVAPPAERAAGTVIVFIHPECACSQATLTNLRDIASELPSARFVVEFESEGKSAHAILSSSNYRLAADIRSAEIEIDYGTKAKVFHAQTSGETFVYSPAGELLYSGGITASRGEPGSNVGLDAIVDCLRHRSPKVRHMPTFGCALTSETSL